MRTHVERAAPAVLGQLLDAAAVALRKYRTRRSAAPTPHGGPTRWIEAAAEVLGLAPGQFLDAYRASRARAGELALESSIVGTHLEAFLALRKVAGRRRGCRRGSTARRNSCWRISNGYMAMAGRARGNSWPRTPQGMGRALHRIKPALEMVGYTVVFKRDPHTQKRDRWITLAAPGVEVPSDVSDVSDISFATLQKKDGHGARGMPPSHQQNPQTNVRNVRNVRTAPSQGRAPACRS